VPRKEYELRQLAAFKADVLTAVGRIFVEAVFAAYRERAERAGLEDAQCGAVTFVQRFGSLNLNVHFHVMVLDPLVRHSGVLGPRSSWRREIVPKPRTPIAAGFS
jgi:hypothetical protein